MSDDEIVAQFEEIVGELKKPFLNATEVSTMDGGSEEANSEQDVSILPEIERRLDTLCGAIRQLIHSNGSVQENNNLDMQSLYDLFERKGIFTALKSNPGLKERYLESANTILKQYPFTRNIKHVRKLKGTPSYREIIPNNE